MGQKAKPKILRINISDEWDSMWYGSKKTYKHFLLIDYKIRNYLRNALKVAGVSKIKINRKSNITNVIVDVARPGIIFGKKGIEIKDIVNEMKQKIDKKVHLEIKEIRSPDLDSKIVAEFIASQLVKRVPFRRAMKQGLQKVLKSGALGVRIACAGRLGGVEIARKEELKEGSVPLQTFRAVIDYALAKASTIYGICGVKVWIYKGDKVTKKA